MPVMPAWRRSMQISIIAPSGRLPFLYAAAQGFQTVTVHKSCASGNGTLHARRRFGGLRLSSHCATWRSRPPRGGPPEHKVAPRPTRARAKSS